MFSQIELEGQTVGLLPNREALGVLKFNCSGGGHHSFPIDHHGTGGHCPPVTTTHCGDHPAPVHHEPPVHCPPVVHHAPVHCPPVHHAPVHHPVHHAPVHHHPEHGWDRPLGGDHGRMGGDC